jgi:predicted SAM-dependent methyltransferase
MPEEIRLNLGCGQRKIAGYVNIDMRRDEKLNVLPDVVLDVTEGLPYENDSVIEVRAYDFLEHIKPSCVIPLIEEVYRVLVPGGKFDTLTPSTDGRGAFQDPTHVSFWNANSWDYYIEDELRGLYGIKAKFKNVLIHDLRGVKNIIHTHAVLYACKTVN